MVYHYINTFGVILGGTLHALKKKLKKKNRHFEVDGVCEVCFVLADVCTAVYGMWSTSVDAHIIVIIVMFKIIELERPFILVLVFTLRTKVCLDYCIILFKKPSLKKKNINRNINRTLSHTSQHVSCLHATTSNICSTNSCKPHMKIDKMEQCGRASSSLVISPEQAASFSTAQLPTGLWQQLVSFSLLQTIPEIETYSLRSDWISRSVK